MHIVTSGGNYVDIDALACAISYSELLNLQNIPAKAVITAPLNQSISPTVLSWGLNINMRYRSTNKDQYVIVDLSDPSEIESFVDTDRIIEIIDHHSGFEKYWVKFPEVTSHIVPIGAAATLVYEKWAKAGLLSKMSRLSRKLLMTAILDNTLYFKAQICTERDILAYKQLTKNSSLDSRWPIKYFHECQLEIEANLERSLELDSKIMKLQSLPEKVYCSQLVVFRGNNIAKIQLPQIIKFLSDKPQPAFLNLVSIDENFSYFITQNSIIKSWLDRILKVKYEGNTALSSRLWLRKEIVKKAG